MITLILREETLIRLPGRTCISLAIMVLMRMKLWIVYSPDMPRKVALPQATRPDRSF